MAKGAIGGLTTENGDSLRVYLSLRQGRRRGHLFYIEPLDLGILLRFSVPGVVRSLCTVHLCAPRISLHSCGVGNCLVAKRSSRSRGLPLGVYTSPS